LSQDRNRQRPRSSKKRRATASGAAPAAAPGAPIQRVAGGRPRPRQAARSSGGIPTGWLVGIAVVIVGVGLGFATGAIKLGSGGGGSATPSRAAAASVAPRGTNCPTAQPPAAPAGQTRVVTIATAKGSFEITLQADLSPIAVGNFAALAGCGYYNGIVFHRVATLQDGTPFVIQGGDPTGTGRGGPGYTIQDEPVTATYQRGTVAMARTAQPNSVGSQFFVVLDDKDRDVLASANTYQIIGSVTKGMETVDAIYAAAGGQENPASPVVMDTVTITNP
jgi:peptidyl-prolyl cis-trans isomerase B (cyclophilin B)